MQVMLIPAKHESFYFTHWYAEFVQSVSSINFSLSDKKKRERVHCLHLTLQ